MKLIINGQVIRFWLFCSGRNKVSWNFAIEDPKPSCYPDLWDKIMTHVRFVNSLEQGTDGPTWGGLNGEELFKHLLEGK